MVYSWYVDIVNNSKPIWMSFFASLVENGNVGVYLIVSLINWSVYLNLEISSAVTSDCCSGKISRISWKTLSWYSGCKASISIIYDTVNAVVSKPYSLIFTFTFQIQRKCTLLTPAIMVDACTIISCSVKQLRSTDSLTISSIKMLYRRCPNSSSSLHLLDSSLDFLFLNSSIFLSSIYFVEKQIATLKR